MSSGGYRAFYAFEKSVFTVIPEARRDSFDAIAFELLNESMS
jgi:hypothetical protein